MSGTARITPERAWTPLPSLPRCDQGLASPATLKLASNALSAAARVLANAPRGDRRRARLSGLAKETPRSIADTLAPPILPGPAPARIPAVFAVAAGYRRVY
jgi:hypothetical protein